MPSEPAAGAPAPGGSPGAADSWPPAQARRRARPTFPHRLKRLAQELHCHHIQRSDGRRLRGWRRRKPLRRKEMGRGQCCGGRAVRRTGRDISVWNRPHTGRRLSVPRWGVPLALPGPGPALQALRPRRPPPGRVVWDRLPVAGQGLARARPRGRPACCGGHAQDVAPAQRCLPGARALEARIVPPASRDSRAMVA